MALPCPPSNRPVYEGLLQAITAARKDGKFTHKLSLISVNMCVHQIMDMEMSIKQKNNPTCLSQIGRPAGRKKNPSFSTIKTICV